MGPCVQRTGNLADGIAGRRVRRVRTMKSKLHAWSIAVAMSLPMLAVAQASKPPSLLNYRSAFGDYKPYQDLPVGNWRAVNDAVAGAAGGASGHAGHGMSGMPGMADMPKPAASTPAVPMHDSAHHTMQGGKK